MMSIGGTSSGRTPARRVLDIYRDDDDCFRLLIYTYYDEKERLDIVVNANELFRALLAVHCDAEFIFEGDEPFPADDEPDPPPPPSEPSKPAKKKPATKPRQRKKK